MASSVTIRSTEREGVYVGSSASWTFEFGPSSEPGPRSVDLLLSALGTCTIGVVGHFMRRKGYATDKLEIILACELDADSNRYGAITLNLRLGVDLTAAQRRSIRAVAESCRIHKTLKNFAGVILEIEALPRALA